MSSILNHSLSDKDVLVQIQSKIVRASERNGTKWNLQRKGSNLTQSKQKISQQKIRWRTAQKWNDEA